MAGVHRSQFTEAMKKEMYSYFWENYNETPPRYQDIFEVVPGDSAYNKFTSAIGLGELLEKPEGEDLQSDAPMESYTIIVKHRSFGRLVRFSKETIDDTKQLSNILMGTVGTWGAQVPRTKEKFYSKLFRYGAYDAGHAVFNNAITGVIDDASADKIYDDVPFFDTAHPDKVGNTYINYTSSRALTHDNLKTTYVTYTTVNNRDERGDIVELSPDTLLIPPALRFTAQVILNTTLLPGGHDNDINVLSSIVSPMEWAYLDDLDGWFLGKAKAGLMATNREEPTLDFWQDETSKDYFASIFTRFGGNITNWRFFQLFQVLSQGLPSLKGVVKNRVNSGNTPTNVRTILSQVWKETSLKVQRLIDEAKSIFFDMPVTLTRAPCSA